MGYLNNNLDHSPIFMHKHAGLVLADMAQYRREGKIWQTNSNNFPQLTLPSTHTYKKFYQCIVDLTFPSAWQGF